jgi:hypothetical protein
VEADDAAGLFEDPERVWIAGRDADPRRPVEARCYPLDIEGVRPAALRRDPRMVDAGQRVAQRSDGDRGRGEQGRGADEGGEAAD